MFIVMPSVTIFHFVLYMVNVYEISIFVPNSDKKLIMCCTSFMSLEITLQWF